MEVGLFARQATAARRGRIHIDQAAYPYVYCLLSILACFTAEYQAGVDASMLSGLIILLGSGIGQLCVLNLCISSVLLALHGMQRLIFGKLRTVEWHHIWERFLSYLMGQLVVLGAVVEPDMAELSLWGGFSLLVGVLGLYAGRRRACRCSTTRRNCVCCHVIVT